MHKLMEYICEELEDLERKAGKEGKLSAVEIEYADKLAHLKKNLLKADEMWEDSEYSEEGGSSYRQGGGSSYAGGGSGQSRRGGSSRRGGGSSRRGGSSYERGGSSYEMEGGSSYEGGGSSYARGRGRNARRDSRGRYSSAGDDIVMELEELMQEAPNEQVKMELQQMIQRVEGMM